jgi:hypothetical protein
MSMIVGSNKGVDELQWIFLDLGVEVRAKEQGADGEDQRTHGKNFPNIVKAYVVPGVKKHAAYGCSPRVFTKKLICEIQDAAAVVEHQEEAG